MAVEDMDGKVTMAAATVEALCRSDAMTPDEAVTFLDAVIKRLEAQRAGVAAAAREAGDAA